MEKWKCSGAQRIIQERDAPDDPSGSPLIPHPAGTHPGSGISFPESAPLEAVAGGTPR